MSKEWLEKKFQDLDITVKRFGEYESIIGILKGRWLSSNKIVVIGAHFDTTNDTEGANDNAGGVALVLEIAKILSNYSFQYDIYFTCFNCEEDGKRGSGEIAENFFIERKEVIICLNADMILHDDPDKPLNQKQNFYYYINQDNKSDIRFMEWAQKAENISKTYGRGYCSIQKPSETCNSDQKSFWTRGFPAITVFTDRDSYYHKWGDNLNNSELNLTYALESVSTFATIAALAADLGEKTLNYKLETIIKSKWDGIIFNVIVTSSFQQKIRFIFQELIKVSLLKYNLIFNMKL